jgi:hypothetical protein
LGARKTYSGIRHSNRAKGEVRSWLIIAADIAGKLLQETRAVTVQEILTKYDIPKHTLAALAEVSPGDLSTYLRRGYISGSRIAKIERAADELQMCYERLEMMGRATGVYLSVRPKDVDSIRNFVRWIKDHPEPAEQQAQQVSA